MSSYGLELAAQGVISTPSLGHLAKLYLGLHISAQVCLAILVTTCFSKTGLRHPTLVNFLCAWLVHSVVACLLLYSRETIQTETPGLCLAQSALLHGTLPMCATATLVVVVQAWSMFHQPEPGSKRWSCSVGLIVKLTLPYVVFLAFTIVTAVMQRYSPTYVNASNGLYCSFYKDPFRRYGVTVYCISILSLILIVEIAIGIRYFYTWRQIATIFPLANRYTSPALVVRLMLFNLYSLVSLGAGIVFVSNNAQTWPYMIQAGLPLAVVLVFGSQKDFFLAWCFWKRKRKVEAAECTFRCRKVDSVEDLLKRTPSPSIILLTPSIATHSQNNVEVLDA